MSGIATWTLLEAASYKCTTHDTEVLHWLLRYSRKPAPRTLGSENNDPSCGTFETVSLVSGSNLNGILMTKLLWPFRRLQMGHPVENSILSICSFYTCCQEENKIRHKPSPYSFCLKNKKYGKLSGELITTRIRRTGEGNSFSLFVCPHTGGTLAKVGKVGTPGQVR